MKTLRLSLPLFMLFILFVSGRAMAASSNTPSVTEEPVVADSKQAAPTDIVTVVSEASIFPSRGSGDKPDSPLNLSTEINVETPAWPVRTDNSQLGLEMAAGIPWTESLLGSADGSLVSQWLKARTIREADLNDANIVKRSPTMASMPDLETADTGSGWCNYCGCWLRHGKDPNGTPQEQIGHPYVCIGGIDSQTCWSHYYTYCISTG
jgi:hypothetical protein